MPALTGDRDTARPDAPSLQHLAAAALAEDM
jgi:hypothetical protein